MGIAPESKLLATSSALKLWVVMTECGVHKRYNSETFHMGAVSRKE